MVKGVFVAFLSLLLLTACSTQQQKAASLAEAMDLERISITELQKITDSSILDGTLAETEYGEKLQKALSRIG